VIINGNAARVIGVPATPITRFIAVVKTLVAAAAPRVRRARWLGKGVWPGPRSGCHREGVAGFLPSDDTKLTRCAQGAGLVVSITINPAMLPSPLGAGKASAVVRRILSRWCLRTG
jgi:hypothetical protein